MKLLALDLDGTLTNSHKEITPRTLDALMDAQRKGVRLILATGRPPYGVQPLARKLHLEDYHGMLLCFNGGTLIDCTTQEILFDQPLPHHYLPYLCSCAREGDCVVMSYQGDRLLTESPQDPYVQHAVFINKIQIRQVEDFAKDVNPPLNKILIVGDPEKLPPIQQRIEREIPGELNVFTSMPFFLEVVPPGIDKAKTLERLLQLKGLSQEDLIAVGDGYNDLSMIQFAGIGVAMANGEAGVKAKADYVTTHTNDEDGIIEILDKFL